MRWDQAYITGHFPFPRAQSVSTWKRERVSPLFVTTLQASLEVRSAGTAPAVLPCAAWWKGRTPQQDSQLRPVMGSCLKQVTHLCASGLTVSNRVLHLMRWTR